MQIFNMYIYLAIASNDLILCITLCSHYSLGNIQSRLARHGRYFLSKTIQKWSSNQNRLQRTNMRTLAIITIKMPDLFLLFKTYFIDPFINPDKTACIKASFASAALLLLSWNYMSDEFDIADYAVPALVFG